MILKKVKMTTYTLIVVVLIGAVAVGCTFAGSESTGGQEATSLLDSKQELAKTSDEKIRLFVDKAQLKNQSDIYSGLYLSINDEIKYFDWSNLVKVAWEPQLLEEDVNSDGEKELVVILTTGEGTGVLQQDIHVFDIKNFIEYPIETVSDIAAQHIYVDANDQNYTFNIDGKEYTIDKQDLSIQPDHLFDVPVFSNSFYYLINDMKIQASISVQVSPSVFCGDIVVTYEYKNGEFVADSLEYVTAIK